jgi:tetratricopeptide (TPR) repeat protein
LIDTKRASEAEAPLRKAIAVGEQSVANFPDAVTCRAQLGWRYGDLASILFRDPQRLAEVAEVCQRGAAAFRELAAKYPEDPRWPANLAHSLRTRADSLRRLDLDDEAEQYYREAATVLEKSTARFPAEASQQALLVDTYANIALSLAALGRLSEAAELARKVEAHPEAAKSLNQLAWKLATSPDPSARDAARAVELAQKAGLRPNSARGTRLVLPNTARKLAGCDRARQSRWIAQGRRLRLVLTQWPTGSWTTKRKLASGSTKRLRGRKRISRKTKNCSDSALKLRNYWAFKNRAVKQTRNRSGFRVCFRFTKHRPAAKPDIRKRPVSPNREEGHSPASWPPPSARSARWERGILFYRRPQERNDSCTQRNFWHWP